MSEKSLQKLITDWLSYNGFVVIETGQYIESQRPSCTVGAPDLFVRNKKWPFAVWLGVELKTARGKLRTEQKILHDEGGIIVARSLEEVLNEIEQADKILRNRV